MKPTLMRSTIRVSGDNTSLTRQTIKEELKDLVINFLQKHLFEQRSGCFKNVLAKNLYCQVAKFWSRNRKIFQAENIDQEYVLFLIFDEMRGFKIRQELAPTLTEFRKNLDVNKEKSPEYNFPVKDSTSPGQESQFLFDIKDLFDVFHRGRNLNSFRNYFCNNGMLKDDAEEYLLWQSEWFWHEFPPIPNSVSGVFSSEVDISLLKFVSRQNGLYESRYFTDWFAPTLQWTIMYSPNQLHQRFVYEFEFQFSKYKDLLGEAFCEIQYKNYEERHQSQIEILRAKLSMDTVLGVLDKIRESGISITDCFVWIKVAESVEKTQGILELRRMVLKYLRLGNPLRLRKYQYLCCPESSLEQLIINSNSAVSARFTEYCIAQVNNQSYVEDEETLQLNVTNLGKVSLAKVIPYLQTRDKVLEWDILDLAIYEVLKKWEYSTLQRNKVKSAGPNSISEAYSLQCLRETRAKIRKRYQDCLSRLSSKKLVGSTKLTDEEITELLFREKDGRNALQSNQYDSLPPIKLNFDSTTAFSKLFTMRKFSKEEWKQIVKVIVEDHLCEQDFENETNKKDYTLWKHVIRKANVHHHREYSSIAEDFKVVLENIVEYLPPEYQDDTNQQIFKEIWNSKD